MDFIKDTIGHGIRIKVFTVIDPATNKSPLVHVKITINGKNDRSA